MSEVENEKKDDQKANEEGNTNGNTEVKPISYHTFIFPFLWNDGGKISRKEFAKCLNPCLVPEWVPDKLDPNNNEDYSRYRYFNRAALNAMFMNENEGELDDNAIVWNYKFDISRLSKSKESSQWLDEQKGNKNPAKYVIKKGEESYELCINKIRVKLFNSGVGMIIFELENYSRSDEKDILKINEYGRRVFMPHLEGANRSCHLCADLISLHYDEEVVATGRISGAESENARDIILAEPISFILRNENFFSATTSENHSEDKFYIEPIIDDRMFVACFYHNPAFTKAVSKWKKKKYQYRYIIDAIEKVPDAENNTARRLYEMIYVDGDGTTCINRDMLKNLLERSVYARWLEYGTVTGITEYSLVCVSSASETVPYTAHVVHSFLSKYVEMMILVLAQRASLLAFERIISEIACKKSDKDIKEVQEEYILFQSELLLQEVTPQQQGIEMYNMMCEQLFINKQQREIENQIRSLTELSITKSEKRENLILFWLAVLSVAECVDIFASWTSDWWMILKVGITLALAFFCAYMNFWKRDKKY